jgi:hypothetical protein
MMQCTVAGIGMNGTMRQGCALNDAAALEIADGKMDSF